MAETICRQNLGRQTLIRGISQDQYGNLFAIDINGRPVPTKQATIEEGYDTGRADKPRKTTSEIHVDSGFPKQHIDLHLLEFAHLLFVDTNTRVIDGTVIAVTGIVSGIKNGLLSASGKPMIDLRQEICYEFRNPTQPAEQIGWHYAMKHFSLGSLKGKPGSIGVITDHDLGNLDDFNKMKRRIAGLRYIPKEFKLIYACADRAKEHFINRGINLADWTAKNILDLIISDTSNTTALQLASTDEPFSHVRVFRPSNHMPYFDIGKAKQVKPSIITED